MAPGRLSPGRLSPEITAVVVTRGRSQYLPKALVALAGQDVMPDAVVLVDAGARADRAIAEMAIRCGVPKEILSVVHAVRAKNFGQAVAAGLRGRESDGLIWLLHDDCYPEPSCLGLLEAALEMAPSVGVVGPKQLRADDSSLLGEVGVTTTPLGRRVQNGHDGELDQGQFDALEDVLAVGAAGMLIRADVWRALGGLAPALGPFRDGLDFCRRARLAGHRVIVEPAARLEHDQAAYRGLRGVARGRRGARQTHVASIKRSYRARRRAWVFTLLADCSFWAVVPLAAMAVALGLGRFVWRIATKEFRLAADELAAPLAVVSRPDSIMRARYVARRTKRMSRRSLAPLLISAREARAVRRDRRVTESELRRQALAPTEIEAAEHKELASRRRRMATAVGVVAAAVTGVALYRLVGPGVVVGGALGRQDASVMDLLRLATGSWQPLGLGEAGPSDPFSAVLAAVTLVCLGDGTLAIKVMLLGAPLIAAAGAWFASGAASRSVWIRAWVALVWLVAPSLWTALGEGRLGAATAHAALPWVFLGVARGIGVNRLDVRPAVLEDAGGADGLAKLPGGGSTGAVAAAGLAFAVAAAGSPVLLGPGLVALVLVACLAGRGRRLRLIWGALPAVAFFLPLLWSVARGGSWRQLLADPGPVLADAPGEFWLRLAGWSGTPALPGFLPSWAALPIAAAVPVGVLAAALVGLIRRGQAGRAVRLGWCLALLGGLGVAACGRVAVSLSGLTPVRPWSGAAADLVLGGLLIAGAVGLTGLVGERSSRVHALVLAGATAGLVALLAGPVVGGAHAIWARWNHPEVHRSAVDPVSPIAVEGAAGPRGVHTLALTPVAGAGDASAPQALGEAVTWEIIRGAGRQVSEASGIAGGRRLTGLPGSALGPDQAEQAVDAAVARVVARNPGAAALDLALAGIGFVQAPSTNLELTAALDATPGLARATESDQRVVWQVMPGDLELDGRRVDAAARLHVVDGDSATALDSGPGSKISTDLPAGAAGRTIVLAERASSGWHATLDGEPLATTGGLTWAQAFEAPAAGGRLEIWHSQPWAVWAAEAAVWALAGLVALPIRRAAGNREDI